jgi:hypothetical protein
MNARLQAKLITHTLISGVVTAPQNEFRTEQDRRSVISLNLPRDINPVAVTTLQAFSELELYALIHGISHLYVNSGSLFKTPQSLVLKRPQSDTDN